MSTLPLRLRSLVVLFAAFATSIATAQPVQDLTLETPSAGASPQYFPMPFHPPLHMLDNFNRADGPLGSAWVTQAGVPILKSGAISASSSTPSLVTHVGGGGAALEGDIAVTGGGTSYVAFVLEYASVSSNLFVKLQANGSTKFNWLFCYYGNNTGDPFGLGSQQLTAPFNTAHVRVTVAADRDVRVILSEIDGGTSTQTYGCSDAPVSGGWRMGIGTYGPQASLDNFYGESFPSGDANGSGGTDVSDVFYLINYLFAGGPAPK
jgi:hypothetical protein